MKKQTVVSLAFAAVVLLAWAAALNWNKTTSKKQDVWLPSLASEAQGLTSIVLESGKDGKLHLEKKAEGWVVLEKYAYPASMKRIRELIQGLSEAQIKAIKTADPDKLSRLDLADPGKEHGGVRVQLLAGDKVMADVLLGKQGPKFKGRYVRHTQSPQSWLVDKPLSVTVKANDWLDKSIVDVSPNKVRKVVYGTNTSPLTAERNTPDDEHFALHPIPDDRVLAYDGAADIADTVLLGMTLDDVLPRQQAGDGKPVHITEVETFDGQRFTIRQYEPKDGETWVELDVSFDPKLVYAGETKALDDPKAEKTDDGHSDVQKLAAQTQALAERLAPWRFKLSPYQAGALRKTIKDFTREKKTETPSDKAKSGS